MGQGTNAALSPGARGALTSARVAESPPKQSPPEPWRSTGAHLLPQRPVPPEGFSARGQPKPTCTGGCAPSYRGSWQEHLEHLVATFGMGQMMLLLPGMIFSRKGLAVAQKQQQLLNFTGQRDSTKTLSCFLVLFCLSCTLKEKALAQPLLFNCPLAVCLPVAAHVQTQLAAC